MTEPASDRERWLRRVRETYRTYETPGGRNRIWSGDEPGSRLAQSERDAWLARALAPAANGNVIDLGCGDGNVARTMVANNIPPSSYLGVDIIESRIAEARAATPWARFEIASADQVPVADGWADAVVAVTLLSSVQESQYRMAIATEVRRVLRSGGRAVIYDMRLPSPSNPHVTKVTQRDIEQLFPGWESTFKTLTLLPPLARRAIAGTAARYRILRAIPALRSHIGAVLIKP